MSVFILISNMKITNTRNIYGYVCILYVGIGVTIKAAGG